MMTRRLIALTSLFSCLTLLTAGCGSKTGTEAGAEAGAEGSVKAMIAGMEDGRPIVVWEALPESYQTDINELVQSFGNNMDPAAWKQITGLVSSVHQILDGKQEFLLNHPEVLNAEDPEVSQAAVKQSTKLLGAFLDSMQDLDQLKSFDGAAFMTSSGKQMVQHILDLQKTVKDAPGMQDKSQIPTLSNMNVETIESTDTTAKLKLTSPDGKSEEIVDMVLVEGKWLPKQMVDEWDTQMAQAQEQIKALPAQMDSVKGQLMMVSMMASGFLSPLQAAETQEQFNDAVAGIQANAAGMIGGMMGGPSMPPPSNNPSSGGIPSFGNPDPGGSSSNDSDQ